MKFMVHNGPDGAWITNKIIDMYQLTSSTRLLQELAK